MHLSEQRGPSTLPRYQRGGRTGTHTTGGPPTATASVQAGATDLSRPLHDPAALLAQLAAIEASIRDDRHRQPAAVLEAIARSWSAGATVSETAARAGVSREIVRDRLRRAGALEYLFRERHRHVQEVLERQGPELLAAYEAGASVQALAAGAGISEYTLKNYVMARGVAIRNPSRRNRELPARGAELVAAYEAGATLKDLAARTGISWESIRAYLADHGVTIRRGPPGRAQAVLEAHGAGLVAAYEAGTSLAALGAAVGVSGESVRWFLVSRGVTIRRSSRVGSRAIPATRAPEVIAAYKAGASITALAADAGVCRKTLSTFLVAHGARLRHDQGWYRRRHDDG